MFGALLPTKHQTTRGNYSNKSYYHLFAHLAQTGQILNPEIVLATFTTPRVPMRFYGN